MTRLTCVFTCFLLATPVSAQITTGALSGFVQDGSQRPLPHARIVISNAARALSRETVADNAGFYRFLDLEPAPYAVTASADQFDPQSATVTVAVDSPARVDFHLNVAGVHQSVEVPATVSAVQTETSELGGVMDRTRIEQLPLNERDFLQLAYLMAGVTTPVQGSALSGRGEFAVHVNGAREEFNNYLLDGVDNNDQNVNRYVLEPPVDAIQEFKLSTNSYSAEYGRSAGGQLNIITRSGTNDLHGLAYEYLRNRDLDARNFFDGSRKAEYVRNQFGVGAGGAIKKDRVFFFGDFDGLRENAGLTQIGSVPTLALRSGNLTGLGATVINPFTGAPFPGNQIPAGSLDPLAQKVLALFPLPNLPGQSGNYLSQSLHTQHDNQYNARLDYYLSPVDHLALRYTYGGTDLVEPFAEDSTEIPGFGDIARDTGHNAMVHYLRTFGPHAFNSLTLGLNRATRSILQEGHNVDVNKLWGVNYLPTDPLKFGYPGITVGGYSRVGDVSQIPINRAANTYQVSDSISFLKNNHTVKAGVDYRHRQFDGILDLYSRGTMSFSGAISGSSIGDLLLGFPTFDIQAQDNNPQAQRTSAYSAFLQDDWKVRPNLTLNLGVRYEFNSPVTDAHNGMSVLNFKTGALQQVGVNGVSRSGYQPDWNNVAPRVGLAWSLAPGLVVRAGYGIFYDAGITEVNSALYFNPPYFVLRVFFPSQSGLLTLSNPYAASNGFAPPAGLNMLSPDITTGYLQSWNVNIQKDFRSAGTLSAAYAASKGTHLFHSRDLNQPTPGPADLSTREPFPQYSNIFYSESAANSSYQSMQVSFNRSMGRHLSLLLNYTWSKSIDDTSAYLRDAADPNFPQNSRNYAAERGLSSFDTPQRLSAAYVFTLPGRSRWLHGTALRGIITAQSGQPFTPILDFDNSNTGNSGGNVGSDRPNVVGSPHLDHPSPAEWFNTRAFAVPPAYTFGNAGRDIVRGPGYASVDLSVLREFSLGEKARVSVEAQAFNALNRANFNLPELFANEPGTFGRIFSAKPPRQIQFSMRFSF